MGFDALDSQIIQKLDEHKEYVKQNYDSIKLDVQKVETL